METAGDFSAWTSVNVGDGQSLTVSTDTYHHGVNCAKGVTNAGYQTCFAQKGLGSGYTTLYLRVYLKIGTLPPSGGDVRFAFISDTAYNYAVQMRINNTSGTYYARVRNYVASATYTGDAITISADTWHSFELKAVRHESEGEVKMYYDGVEVLSQSGVNTQTENSYGIVGISLSDTYACTNYFDCVVVSDAYIGPEISYIPQSYGDGLSWLHY